MWGAETPAVISLLGEGSQLRSGVGGSQQGSDPEDKTSNTEDKKMWRKIQTFVTLSDLFNYMSQ